MTGQARACYKRKVEATLAQLVEHLIRNQRVAGSTPAGGSILSTTCANFNSFIERLTPFLTPSRGLYRDFQCRAGFLSRAIQLGRADSLESFFPFLKLGLDKRS